MAYMMEDRLKDAAEEADKERALEDVAKAIVMEKLIATENVEARVWGAERARAQEEKQRAEAKVKLGEVELWVADSGSIISAKDKEIAELKATLEESENKYYNMGFNDAENSVEPIMFEAWKHGFSKGWLAVMAMGVPEDSPLRDPDQIPYPESPPTQNPYEAEDEDTPKMREIGAGH